MQCNAIKYKCLPYRESKRNISSPNDIVDDYINSRRQDVQREFKCWQNIPSEDELIQRASFAIQSDDKRNSHHYRKSYLLLQKVYEFLKKEKLMLFSLKRFEEVYDYFEKTIYEFVGIGELYLYDTSLMICVSKNIFPKYIYLHSGTRDGAYELGLPYNEKYLTINQIPKELQKLKAYEIEDVLCIYKKYLSKFKVV